MTDARDSALRQLFDDAGMFPPTAKPLAEALDDHRRQRAGEHGWLAGRFLIPSSRIVDYASALRPDDDWAASVVVQSDDDRPLRAILQEIATYAAAARIESVELRLPGGEPETGFVSATIAATADARIPSLSELWFEISLVSDPDVVTAWLETLAEARARESTVGVGAKIRCGGPVVEAFPSVTAVGEFVSAARQKGVPFKATAGLHHPFGKVNKKVGVREYGFLNLVAAAAIRASDCVEVLDSRHGSMGLNPTGLRWKSVILSEARLSEARKVFVSVGSCSLTEPIDDLIACGVLPTATGARGVNS